MDLNDIIHTAHLIFGHLSESLTAEETAELQEWLERSESNRKLLANFHNKEFLSQKQIISRLCDNNEAFEGFRKRKQRDILRKKQIRIYSRIAAIAILLISIALSLTLSDLLSEKSKPLAESQIIHAGESRAVLILADGQKIKLEETTEETIVHKNGMVVNVNNRQIEYSKTEEDATKQAEYNQLIVPRKGEFQLTLPDGTRVWLNSDSRIKYPVRFTTSERRIYLEGEAYFEVVENKTLPFIVDMGQAQIKVLGTSFNVRAYQDESHICATLTEGSVEFTLDRQKLELCPNEQCTANPATGALSKQKVDVSLYTGWKEGRFIFKDQSLEEIMNILSRWYDIQVFFANTNVRKVIFTGNLKRYDDFNQILEMLQMTGQVQFKITGNTVHITE